MTVHTKYDADTLPNRTPQITKKKSLLNDKKPATSSIYDERSKVVSQKAPVGKKTGLVAKKSEETKYQEMPDKVDINDLEVLSDYSYDDKNDIDRPENTKSVTCRTEVIQNEDGTRDMIIRKQYYLDDGRELRVKNIRPVIDKCDEKEQD